MARWERQPRHELDPTVLEAFTSTFIPRLDQYPQQRPDGTWFTVHQPLTTVLVEAHLRRQITLGAYALNSASMAQWICLDADAQKQWSQLQELHTSLAHQSIPSYLELSRRGGHLWLFTPLLPGSFARRFARQLLFEHQIEEIEIYPKQRQLTTGSGSLVRLPLGVHRKTGQVYHFITSDGQPIAPTIRDQLAILSAPQRVPLPFYLSVLSRAQLPPEPQLEPTTAFRPIANPTKVALSERLKGTVSVLSFVSRYVKLDHKHMGFCPFHDDQHKSFAVHDEGNYWHCFAGCGGGSIIDFWMKWRAKNGQDGSFSATVKDLRAMLIT